MSDFNTVRLLVRYGNSSAENLTKMQGWFSEAMTDLGEGKGANVVSASANGASFTFSQSSDSMSIKDWSIMLDRALQHIEESTYPSQRSIAVIL